MLGTYRREVLPNGLSVLGVENRSVHSFACSAYVHAGPRFEPPERTGLTHFLEHMLMQGSRDFPSFNDIMRCVEDLGGVVDGQTLPEYMTVAFGVHRKHWRRVMDVAADLILRPLLDEGEIEQEKSIVSQEILHHRDRKGRNISVHELAHELLLHEELAEAGTRGYPHITEKFDRPLLEQHYRAFFVPRNMVLCLAGGFDFDEVMDEVRGRFGAAEGEGDLPQLAAPGLSRRRARSFYRSTEALPVAEALLCYHAYPLGADRYDSLRAVGHMLGGGLTSRLFTRVREELGLVYDVHSYPHAFSDVGALYAYVSVSVENLPAALEAMLDVIRRTARENFTQQELDRYQESVRCGMDMLCDHPSRLASWFGRQELLLGPGRVITPAEYVRRQEALTLEDLHATLKEVLVDSGANLAVAGPFGDEEVRRMREVFPAEEARSALDDNNGLNHEGHEEHEAEG